MRDTYDASKVHFVSGKTLNEIARGLARGNPSPASYENGFSGTFGAANNPPPFLIGIAEITDVSNECALDADGNITAPCRNLNLYLAKFRYYDFTTGIWSNDDVEFELDAAPYRDRTRDGDRIPSYIVTDMVPAYFDPLRSKLVPIHSPFEQQVAGEFLPDPAGVSLVPNSAVSPTQTSPIFTVELMSDQQSWRLAGPELYIPTPTENSSRHTGACFSTIRLGGNDLLRMRGTMTDSTDRIVAVPTWGLRIWFLARQHLGIASGGSDYGQPLDNMTDLPFYSVQAGSEGRFKDFPTVTILGNGTLRINTTDVDDVWLCRLEYRADVFIEPGSSSSSSSSSSSLSSSSQSSSNSSSSSSRSSSVSSSSPSSSQSVSESSSSSSSLSVSESSSSLSVSESSSSSYDCFRYVEQYCFDYDNCRSIVTYAEACLPRGSGLIVNHDVEGPAC